VTRFPIVVRLGIHILALLAVLIQCSPLRTCALQSLVGGTSCHDDEGTVAQQSAAVAMSADGCVPHPADGHDDHCTCERPRSSATMTAYGTLAAAAALLPIAGADGFALPSSIESKFLPHHATFRPSPPSAGDCLPLLT
jgi:hypothetical protein